MDRELSIFGMLRDTRARRLGAGRFGTLNVAPLMILENSLK